MVVALVCALGFALPPGVEEAIYALAFPQQLYIEATRVAGNPPGMQENPRTMYARASSGDELVLSEHIQAPPEERVRHCAIFLLHSDTLVERMDLRAAFSWEARPPQGSMADGSIDARLGTRPLYATSNLPRLIGFALREPLGEGAVLGVEVIEDGVCDIVRLTTNLRYHREIDGVSVLEVRWNLLENRIDETAIYSGGFELHRHQLRYDSNGALCRIDWAAHGSTVGSWIIGRWDSSVDAIPATIPLEAAGVFDGVTVVVGDAQHPLVGQPAKYLAGELVSMEAYTARRESGEQLADTRLGAELAWAAERDASAGSTFEYFRRYVVEWKDGDR